MTPPIATLNSDEKVLAILDPDAVFKDPKAEGIEWLKNKYAEKKRKEEGCKET